MECNFGPTVYLTEHTQKISHFHHLSGVHKSADCTELTKARGLRLIN